MCRIGGENLHIMVKDYCATNKSTWQAKLGEALAIRKAGSKADIASFHPAIRAMVGWQVG